MVSPLPVANGRDFVNLVQGIFHIPGCEAGLLMPNAPYSIGGEVEGSGFECIGDLPISFRLCIHAHIQAFP